MAIEDLVQDASRRMDKSVEAAQVEFATLRTGRASPALLDRVQIDYYGQQTPLKQLATISAPEPRLLTIQPFDPNSVSTIERAIQESDLGLTPNNDGKLIRLPIPQPTPPSPPQRPPLPIHPLDPNSVSTLERAIQESDLGLTPNNDGKLIRLPIPQLTEERRKELVKVVRHMAEEGKVAVRNVR